MTTQTRRLVDYTLGEMGAMTNQEILTILENELQYTDEMTESECEGIKDDIKAIKDGTYRNPGKKQIAWGNYLVLGAIYVGVMNIGVGQIVPTIPILSDLTPMVTFVQQQNMFTKQTSSDFRLMSHREFNKLNPNFCQKFGNTGMCVNPVFQGYWSMTNK